MKLVFLAAALAASQAYAQNATDPLVDLSQDWQALASSNRHVADDVQKLIQAYQTLKSENDKLKAPREAPKDAPKAP